MGNNCTSNCSNGEHRSFEERLERTELAVYQLTEIPFEFITRKHVWIKHGHGDEQEVLAIRTVIINDESETKNWFYSLLGI